MLLPAISSNAAIASLNSKLLAAPLLRNFVCSTSLRRKKKLDWRSSRTCGVPVVKSNLTSESQVVVKGMGKPVTPVLLLDVMGTLVRDPFYEDIPAFFG